ncbi:MAG: AAA family ATPase [Clostridia bacterium]|nr:AAA family ATPase [Clostridia bacterium]
MQFYKFEGFTVDNNWSEENDSRRVMNEKIGKISRKTTSFNQKLNDKAFIFVEEAHSDAISIGIIVNKYPDVSKLTVKYLKEIEIELKDTNLEEITLDSLCHMLRNASNHDYIYNVDEVLKKFELDQISNHWGRGFDYEEKILDIRDQQFIYNEVDRFLVKETFIPELDRIYTPCKNKTSGHPVHYMIQTDDRDICKKMYRALLNALYANERITSKRYCFLEFNPYSNFSRTTYDYLYKSNIGGAIVVRYKANDDTEDDHANYGREIIAKLCEVMKKYSNQVLTIFCLPRECTKSKDIFYEHLGNLSIVELKEEFASNERARSFLKMLAKNKKIRTDKNLFDKLEKDKGYLAPDLHDIFDYWYNNKLKTSVYPQYKDIVTAKREVIKAAPKGSAYDELNKMIGLSEAKKVINQALNYYKAQKLFADKGMKADHPAMHMVFTGNPGTAKTTVARLFANIMKENGVLSKGNIVEVGRGDLVGKYVGWTAPTIQRKFREAQGSVLFIDEAYSLVDDRDGSYGDEAINTIVQEMENHRDDVVVIFAGYPDKMEKFLQKNPGLKSRIAYHVPFSDYNTEELCEIAKLIAKKKGLEFAEDANDKLIDLFEKARVDDDFGNGRYARNVIEKARMTQASRLLTMDFDSISREDIGMIIADDIEIPMTTTKSEKKRFGFCA